MFHSVNISRSQSPFYRFRQDLDIFIFFLRLIDDIRRLIFRVSINYQNIKVVTGNFLKDFFQIINKPAYCTGFVVCWNNYSNLHFRLYNETLGPSSFVSNSSNGFPPNFESATENLESSPKEITSSPRLEIFINRPCNSGSFLKSFRDKIKY